MVDCLFPLQPWQARGSFSAVPNGFSQKHIEGKTLDLPVVWTLGSKTGKWPGWALLEVSRLAGPSQKHPFHPGPELPPDPSSCVARASS